MSGHLKVAALLAQQNLWSSNISRYLYFSAVAVLHVVITAPSKLVKATKPTGDAECPPNVCRAHEIDDLMNEKAGTRDLNDSDIADADNDAFYSDDEEPSTKSIPAAKHTNAATTTNENTALGPVARRVISNRLPSNTTSGSNRNASHDLLASITNVLDPRSREARTEERSMTAFQSQQLFTLSSQLQDTQRQLEAVRQQLSAAERLCNDAERCADRAEMLSMFRTRHSNPHSHSFATPRFSHSATRHSQSTHRKSRDTPHAGCRPHYRYHHDVYYKDGGRAVQWVGSDDDHNPAEHDSPDTSHLVTLCSSDDNSKGSSQYGGKEPTTPTPASASRQAFLSPSPDI